MSGKIRELSRVAVALQIMALVGGAAMFVPDAATAQSLPARASAPPVPERPPELNTILMKSTYMVTGPLAGDLTNTKVSFGTAFLMGKPIPSDPAREFYVLITAGHVLDKIGGDVAVLKLRQPQADGSYLEKPWPVKIRDKGRNLYVEPPDADVAALYVDMPDDLNVTIVPTGLLANDEQLERFEVHPGDELFCLGFPLGVSTLGGFPILRSGKIASYPITPTSIYRVFSFDFNVFEGNSGGPVYFVDHDRTYGGSTHLGEIDQFVVGLVIVSVHSSAYNGEEIRLAGVVPSSYILEALRLLPATSPYK